MSQTSSYHQCRTQFTELHFNSGRCFLVLPHNFIFGSDSTKQPLLLSAWKYDTLFGNKGACGNHWIKTVMLCYIWWGKKILKKSLKNHLRSTQGYIQQREIKSAVRKFVLPIETLKQDTGNAMKITASVGYYLMTAVIWSSADDKQMKSLFCLLYFMYKTGRKKETWESKA